MYRLPVLLEANGMQSGQVVEVGLTVDADGRVHYTSMQLREAGKLPNFLWAAWTVRRHGG